MQYANNKMELDLVLVSTIIMGIHMTVADLSAFTVRIVQQIRPVSEINVSTRAQEYVE